MKHLPEGISKRLALPMASAILMIAASIKTVQAADWKALVGAESPHGGSQALAFLTNELWIHPGDSIQLDVSYA